MSKRITREKAKYIIVVLNLAADKYAREEAVDSPEKNAAEIIAKRYSELKGDLGFQEAADVAMIEFLTSI